MTSKAQSKTKAQSKAQSEFRDDLNVFHVSGVVKWVSDTGNRFILSSNYEGFNKDGDKIELFASVTLTSFDEDIVEVGDALEITGHFTSRKYNDKYYNDMVCDAIKVL